MFASPLIPATLTKSASSVTGGSGVAAAMPEVPERDVISAGDEFVISDEGVGSREQVVMKGMFRTNVAIR